MLDRRSFLAATTSGFGAALAAAPPSQVAASLSHAAHLADSGQQPAFEVLTAEQAADIEAIAAQVIPSEADSPGAREARVIHFLDHSLNSWARGQRQQVVNGLALFNNLVMTRYAGRRFSQLTADEQLEFLRANEQQGFFQQMRFVTIQGMFANPQWRGNFEGAGYRLLGFEPRFVWEPPFGEYDAEVHRGRGGRS